MNQNLTELVFILDKSGSMHGLEEDTIGGFNSVIEEQKEKEGDVLVSTVLFNQENRVVHDRVSLKDIAPMTRRDYQTGGSTALVDAVGDAIHHIGNVHKYAREEDRPAHTVFVIITDGMENASHRYTADEIRSKITRQKEEYGWEFLFLGANMDAVETARHYGIGADRSARFHNDAEGQKKNYEAVSCFMSEVRENAKPTEAWADGIREDYAKRKR